MSHNEHRHDMADHIAAEIRKGKPLPTITDERMAEIKAGLMGVTPGPWRTPGPKVPWVVRVGGDDYGSVQIAECGNYRDKEIARYNMPRWRADAAHIARMDPATVAALIARVEAAEARVKALEEALTPSGDTKAAYIGEFRFRFSVHDSDGWGDPSPNVPWTTIKEIMAAIRARAALEGK
jgi:hypothetical protein